MVAAAIEVQRVQSLDHDESKEEERDNRIVDAENAPPKKERGGLAFVVKLNGKCMVLGGPKNHVAQPGEKITWIVLNGCDQKVTVELTAKPSTTSGAPASPFKQGNGPHAVNDLDPGQTKKLTLEVLDQGFPADTESVYTYSILIKGDDTSGIDPELDIWP